MEKFEKDFKRKVNMVKPNKKKQKEIYKQITNKEKNIKSIYFRVALSSMILIMFLGIAFICEGEIKQIYSSVKVKYNEKMENNNDFNSKNVIKTNYVTDKLFGDDFSNLVKHSDALVKGKVLAVQYEAIEGNAWTKILLHIDDVFKGEVKKGENIEIYYSGGYISLDDHIKYYDDLYRFANLSASERKNTVLKEIIDGEEDFIKKGEELVLCLVKTLDVSPLPKNSYERLSAAGMLKEKDSKYIQVYGESENKYSVAKDEISNIKNLIHNNEDIR